MGCTVAAIKLIAAVNGTELWIRTDDIDAVMKMRVAECAVRSQAGSVLMSHGEAIEVCNVTDVVRDWQKALRSCKERR